MDDLKPEEEFSTVNVATPPGKESANLDNTGAKLEGSTPKIDFYEVLSLPRTATDKEIMAAYEQLAIKYQTTKSPEDEEICKNINQAVFVLSNPVTRRHYDETGEVISPPSEHHPEEAPDSMDVSHLGGIGRVFGAVISRLGVPIQTQIAHDVVQIAQDICRKGTVTDGESQPIDPRVSDFYWGWGIESRVDRQAGTFFRLNVEDKHVENGFILYCRSPSKGKFKLLIFDKDGKIVFQEVCVKSRDNGVTHAALYFTNFTTYRLGEPIPGHLREQDIPLLFSKLDNFIKNDYIMVPGQYLICVYGDNFLGKTNFTLLSLYAKNDCNEVTEIQDIDDKLLQSKESLESFRAEFVKARETYEKAVRRLEVENLALEDLLDRREEAYRNFLAVSAKANAVTADTPPPGMITPSTTSTSTSTSSTTNKNNHGGNASSSSSSTSPHLMEDASVAAAAAGGWIASRMACELTRD